MDDGDTAALFRDGERAESRNGVPDTIDLVTGGLINVSTERLLQESLTGLLGSVIGGIDEESRGYISDTDVVGRRLFEDLKVSSADDEIPTTGQEESRYEGLPKDTMFQIRQVEHVLEMLYNTIQVFLLRNSMSLTFLKMFKAYVQHLVEFDRNPLKDPNLLILQDELHKNKLMRLTEPIEKVIKTFLIEPDNLIMRFTYFEFQSRERLLKTALSLWRIKLAGHGNYLIYERFIRAKFFGSWKVTADKYAKELLQQSGFANELRLKEFVLDKLLLKLDASKRMGLVADNKFNRVYWRKIVKRFDSLAKAENHLRDWRRLTSMNLFWRKWVLEHKAQNFHPRSLHLQRGMLRKWGGKINALQELYDRARITNYLFMIQPKFLKWGKSLRASSASQQELERREPLFVKKMYLGVWLRSLNMVKQETITKDILQRKLLKYILTKVWRRRFQEQLHFYSLSSINDERLKRRCLLSMKKQFYSNVKADQILREIVLKKFIKIWQALLLSKKIESGNEDNCLKNCMHIWMKRTKLRGLSRRYTENKLLRPWYSKWSVRVTKLMEQEKAANSVHCKKIGKRNYNIWRKQFAKIVELDGRLEIIVKMNALGRIGTKLDHLSRLDRVFDTRAKPLSSRRIRTKYLRVWEERHILLTEVRLSERLSIYRARRDRKLVMAKFQSYLKKLRLFQYELPRYAVEQHNRTLRGKIFGVMVERHLERENVLLSADTVRDRTILYDMFALWAYRKFDIDELAEERLNERNLRLLSTTLQGWSLRHFKAVRNERTMQLFRQRWDRAVLRGLLLLWRNRQLETIQPVVLEDTTGNNTLKTPMRKPDDSTFPGSTDIRRHKMAETISRYRKARRAIPSPLKSSTSLTTPTKRMFQQRGLRGPTDSTPRPPKLDFGNLQPLRPDSTRETTRASRTARLNGSPTHR
ncbi:Sfi1p KNAG_0H02460 [Huiozyma naganishii CBS 8797]|uniref:Sfi1 spindle body domain-containing protein n=1 Tax=Huiozyma naganishii (strain ATCC MYA-139 / BCRC 22969 / CBS 8797 / KCTC 17520 / NBRC 10181 / NCYC 3082 / Yp74L-3) TaxID=1071383 RepID=J7S9R5_HUIN7|nr:hypothetical protein KNAG_0H02460 [Kazachstania naganishii CBS 8797]CCK71661.1 hypothetical protein KNAG_0H02460 [Kazachstania naganishii CBS 8797]